MPHKDPAEKARKQAEYREARRSELAAKQRDYYQATKHERFASMKRYAAEHPYCHKAIVFAIAANKRAAYWGHSTRIKGAEILARWPRLELGTCSYCLSPAELLDHVIPICRGGANHVSNLTPACDLCNRSKAHRTADEFRAGISVRRPRRVAR